jgi:thioesterase domain-containing protein
MTTQIEQLLVPLNDVRSGRTLHCVHPVSGSPYVYSGLARMLGDCAAVVGIEAPGFDTSRIPLDSVPALAAEYVSALRPGAPHHLLGWSMGGVIAYEMAGLLQAAGQQVGTLMLIDTPVPLVEPVPDQRRILDLFLANLVGTAGVPGAAYADVAPSITEPEPYFAALAAAGVLDEDADVLLDQFPVFAAHVRALAEHRASGGFHGTLTFIRAAQSSAELLDWSGLASVVETHVVPGSHYSIWGPGGVAALSDLVRATLVGVGR